MAAAVSSVNLSSPAWTSPTLDGQLYGEPLASGGRIFVATENDTVYALSATNGAVEWSSHLGTPVPSGSLPCGNISPSVGITGTPVIDEARSELFVVADELVNGSPAHELVGLNTATGKTELTQGVDPTGSTPAALLQRTGLTLDAGRVVFGYGGNYGDCGSYRGWVVSVPEAGRHPGGVRRRLGDRREPGRDLDGWRGPGRRRERQRLGHRRQRLGHLDQPRLRRQRLGARALTVAGPAAVLRPVLVGHQQRRRPRPLHRARPARRRAGGGGRQVADRVPAQRVRPRRHRRPGGIAAIRVRRRHRRRRRGRWDDRLPPLPERHHRRAGIGLPGRRSVSCGAPPWAAGHRSWRPDWSGRSARTATSTRSTRRPVPCRGSATVGAPANHFPTPSVGAGLLLAPAADRVVAFSAPSTAATDVHHHDDGRPTRRPPRPPRRPRRPHRLGARTPGPSQSRSSAAWPSWAV